MCGSSKKNHPIPLFSVFIQRSGTVPLKQKITFTGFLEPRVQVESKTSCQYFQICTSILLVVCTVFHRCLLGHPTL